MDLIFAARPFGFAPSVTYGIARQICSVNLHLIVDALTDKLRRREITVIMLIRKWFLIALFLSHDAIYELLRFLPSLHTAGTCSSLNSSPSPSSLQIRFSTEIPWLNLDSQTVNKKSRWNIESNDGGERGKRKPLRANPESKFNRLLHVPLCFFIFIDERREQEVNEHSGDYRQNA